MSNTYSVTVRNIKTITFKDGRSYVSHVTKLVFDPALQAEDATALAKQVGPNNIKLNENGKTVVDLATNKRVRVAGQISDLTGIEYEDDND